jgi:histidine kinase
MLAELRSHLVWKLLLAFLAVIVVGILGWALAVQLVSPSVFERHMVGMDMLDMGSGMMSENELLLSFRDAMNEVLLWGAAASVAAALLVSWLLSRQLVAPVREMMEASQHIADGSYERRVATPNGGPVDELGQLALSFNRMAEQLQQIEAMRLQLIGDVSHELRTPLTSIKGSMEGLIDGVLPSTPETFQSVHREAERLQRLVADLQDLSRAEAGSYEIQTDLLDVSNLFEMVRQRLERQFEEKGVALEIMLAEEPLQILGDEDRTMQVLINLVGNALQYTPKGGEVRVTVRRIVGEVEFSVRDTGIGIAQEDLANVFRRFFRVDKSRARASGGSGVGLTIAKKFVEVQGGRIWAESEGPGKGAAFRFTLPLAT